MKTTKLISALLMPAMFVACSDDVFEGMNLENNLATGELVEDVTLVVGLEDGAESRGTFAEDATKGVFGKFYFEPQFYVTDPNNPSATIPAGGEVGDLVKTNNANIYGDQVGLCLPSAAADGNVVTNVPFYIAGYMAEPAATPGALPTIHTLAEDDFYFNDDEDVAFGATTEIESGDMTASITALSAADYTGPGAGKTNIQKAVFKSVSGLMKGNYVLYYPYKESFDEQGKIPATELKSIQTQGYNSGTPTTDHVVGKNLFAYAKTPFAVAGGKSEAKNMNMGTAAYIFQFRVYNTGATAIDHSTVGNIKLITVTTADDAKAFGINGFVTAGTTNTFAADTETAVDMIGVEVSDITVPTATADNYKTVAAKAYLSTYPVNSQLSGKNIVVRLYTTKGKVAEIVKAAGSKIVEGETDYWNLDLNGVTFTDAERLVYNETSLRTELGMGGTPVPGTLVLKANIPTTQTLNIPTGFTISGADYSLNLGAATTITGNVALNTTVNNASTLTVGNAVVGPENATSATIATLNNKGTVVIKNNAALTATTVNNGGETMAASATVAYNSFTVEEKLSATDVNGKLVATTFNNLAPTKDADNQYVTKAGQIFVNGDIASSTIENAGDVQWYSAMVSTVTVNNDATMAVGNSATLGGTIVNDGIMTVGLAPAANVKATNATITNNGEITSQGAFTLTGTTTFTNNGDITDNGVFSGLSRLTNAEDATVVRTVSALTNFKAALAEDKLTGINISAAIYEQDAEGNEILTVETTKTIILSNSLTLSTTDESSFKNIVLNGGTLVGKVAAEAINVTADSSIGAGSNVNVSGTITVGTGYILTGVAGSYTECADLVGNVSGTIYVK